jgi:hypothetical protein
MNDLVTLVVRRAAIIRIDAALARWDTAAAGTTNTTARPVMR